MVNPNNIFSLFNSSKENKSNNKEEEQLYIDLINNPLYWVGMFQKIIMNSPDVNKILKEELKKLDKSLDFNEIETAGETYIFNRAYDFIQNINLQEKSHIHALSHGNTTHLETAINLSLNFFEENEEYEKCVHLSKILNKYKDLKK